MRTERPTIRRAGFLLFCAGMLAGAATAWLGYLLWAEVPAHATRAIDAGLAVSRSAVIAFWMSTWLVGLLPLVVLAVIPALTLSILVGAIAVARGVALRVVFLAGAAVLSAIGFCELCAGLFVMYALR